MDPSRWPIAFAGFFTDWVITREWKRILLFMFPAVLLLLLVSFVVAGSTLNKRELASWYLEKGEEEFSDWESSWAPTTGGSTATEDKDAASGSDAEATSTSNSMDGAATTDGDGAEKTDEEADSSKVSRYAELLFRRVQMLEPSNRSQFVIGATMAQRGAMEQAKRMLSKIAPDDSTGYAPAHAFLTMIYLREIQAAPKPELVPLIKHHSQIAANWDRAPQEVLLAGSQIAANSDNKGQSLKMLEKAAERDPILYVELAKRAALDNNTLLEQHAMRKVLDHLEGKVADNPRDDLSRTQLASLYLAREDDAKSSEELIREGLKLETTPLLTRALSDIYRYRFKRSISRDGDAQTANVSLLDQAMRIDPTNPGVGEDVALLARVEGAASEDLVNKLQEFLMAGQATALTHAWLSEAFLLKKEYARAIPHLEQVVTRLPNATQSLNNLAYVLAELHPERLPEALEYAQRATMLTSRPNERPNPDYYDTLGTILARMDRTSEAIAAYETAIQLAPRRDDFHTRVAEQYRKAGAQDMAALHERAAVKLLAEAAAREAAPATDEAAEGNATPAAAASSEAASPAASTEADTGDDEAPAPTDASAVKEIGVDE